MASAHTLDMTSGSIVKRLFSFTMPVLCTLVLQHLYTAVDKAIVGQFAANGMQALAAVGATSSVVAMVLNVSNGLASAVNVSCANLLGSGEEEKLRRSMHTAVLSSVVLGVVFGLIGLLASRPVLNLLDTPLDIIAPSTLYLKIYMAGMPATIIYNFSAAILRAHGDTKRPMYILLTTGLLNVVLNVIFVVVLDMSVAGVALATVIAQGISAVWVLRILFDPKDDYKLLPKQLQFHWPSVKKILRIGIPSGLNSLMFSVANMILQASINSFHDTAIIAGKTAATDVGELVSQIQYAFGVTCMSFAGQCYGAKNYKRIDKMLMKAIPICCGVMAVFAALITAFPTFVIAIFNSDPAVAAAGKEVLLTIIWGYLLFAVAQMFYNVCRGMGASMGVTLINMLGIIVPRLIWIWVFFPMRHSISWLYICYPLSWFISAVLQGAYYIHLRRKMEKML